MKKFTISYIACLLAFSIVVNVPQYIRVPNYADSWGPIWLSIIMFSILGSMPVLIGCLIGEFCYRKIKGSHELKIGVPLFRSFSGYWPSYYRIICTVLSCQTALILYSLQKNVITPDKLSNNILLTKFVSN